MNNRILIADDEDAIRFAFTFVLNKAGYQAAEAQNGREALSLILKGQKAGKPFDLLITDMQMPAMSGIELIHEIRMYNLSMPVIVVSGLMDQDLVNQVINDGYSEFFLKPFDIQKLTERVGNALEKNRLKKQSMTLCTTSI